ncbi:hypothetical protein FOCC_FOCC003603, partial [Frankliniella occidentalis]
MCFADGRHVPLSRVHGALHVSSQGLNGLEMRPGWWPGWLPLLLVLALPSAYTQPTIGHFWHISDLHYDVNFSLDGDIRHSEYRPRPVIAPLRRRAADPRKRDAARQLPPDTASIFKSPASTAAGKEQRSRCAASRSLPLPQPNFLAH